MENLPKGENLYLYGGTIYNGGGGGNNNGGGNGGGYGGGCGGGGGNGPREGLRREPREILPIKRGGISLRAFNARGSTSGGNKGTPRYLARPKKITRYKTRGGLLIA